MAIDKVLVQAVEAHQAGRREEAEKLYRKILLKRPRDQLAVQNLGALLYERGELDEAAKLLRRALSIDPRDTDALNNLGNTLRAQGQPAEAEANFRKAIAIRPNAMVLNSFGNLLRSRGDYAEAIACYEQALQLQPDYLHSHYHLAMTYRLTGRLAEAVAIQEKALAINPRFPQVLMQLGLCLSELGRIAEAIVRYREALAIAPQFYEAWSNLGNALQRTRDLAGAETAYREALRLKPDFPNALGNLGTLLAESNRRREAIALFERVAALNPDHDGIWGKLSFEKRNLCDWRDYDSLVDGRVREQVRAGSRKTTAFSLLTLSSTPQEQLLVARAYAEATGASAIALPQRAPQQRARLRIGYLSADFHPHATAYLIAELMERHDRNRFEIVAYSIGPDSDTAMRRRLVAAFDSFVDLRPLSHDAAAQRIHADDLDILVDLKGYTQNARSEILARRPAPIQVNYLGYPGTMGASFIDYVIADAFIIPPAQHAFYDEKVVTLPHCYQPNDTRRPISDQRPTRAACGLPENGFVFASFNNSYKITPLIFDIWMRLLDQVPGSVLWQLEAEPDAVENLRRETQARGVDPARLVFAPPLELADHLARQSLADLFLDTLPVNAHTTASDALWAGLPVLTCAGDTFISRVAGSVLTTIGLPELITTSLQDYEALALALARDPARLAALRQRLAANRQTSPLFDIARFTRNLEGAYLQMQERRLAGQPPAALTVEDRPG
ncbi:tetratricopeptide repeat protein [Ferrovibrio terrae]|uniref:protein O-GlcNAc transferase n=1 Tax=Ferrovibrio terrae TaxID=2594003 RepID=A0A516GZP8_9PROT|nr:glycosyltransferase family 41 protein [Ferrovibrio terrae]QDO96997.1 tetratricopeptide repeat protein [Ferrovibrio terrae]